MSGINIVFPLDICSSSLGKQSEPGVVLWEVL